MGMVRDKKENLYGSLALEGLSGINLHMLRGTDLRILAKNL